MVSLMCSVFSQLRLLVANLTKKTYKQSTNEIATVTIPRQKPPPFATLPIDFVI